MCDQSSSVGLHTAYTSLCVQRLQFVPRWFTILLILHFDPCDLEKYVKPGVALSVVVLMSGAPTMQIR